MNTAESLALSIATTRQQIDDLAQQYGRRGSDVTLELAAKTRTSQECFWAAQALADAGLPIVLGHNRVQEARATVEAIRRVPGARIHLIGPLQSNKINQALRVVDLIETVDTPELVSQLDTRLDHHLLVYVQVNVSGEPTKGGCLPEFAPAVVDAITQSQHLTLAGFMTVGLNSTVEAQVRTGYAQLRELRNTTAIRIGVPADTLALSMGMSGDLGWAIAEGSTVVRVGTAVFGKRRSF